MSSNFAMVLGLGASMFFLTTFAGVLPHAIHMDKKKQNMLSIYGAGVLIGAALNIVVPEGMILVVKS